jgi:hypothetical protein
MASQSGASSTAQTINACVSVGDVPKVGFKLMKQGHNFGRVLEAVSPALRGNVEKYMRKINWGQLTSECKGLFDKTIAAFIDGLSYKPHSNEDEEI